MSTPIARLATKLALVLVLSAVSVTTSIEAFAQTPIYYDDGYSVPPQNTAEELAQIRRELDAAANIPEPSVTEAIFVGLGVAVFIFAVAGGALMVRDRIRRARA